ncbi:putative membrane protein [Anoxybacillus voinovskiensis]|uniref:Putative membrane protein n=1 Tax=Anoxybacteroides voinovskiense TaxID=230470 RepID=A0A840DTA4_9BACL|nr:TIGR03943 family protein [Anoxybacillus voinovskiensis]MBB4072366.1 putative membrane protein [Anoxybacillus voinovskiensis]GGJ58488.1 TIGR03943 family protein [Anoxybacillus voinovskiensis]
MLRFYILLGFTFLFFHLHITGDISKYINMRYSYLSFSAIFLFAFLTIVQLIIANRKKSEHHCHDECCHPHEEQQTAWKKALHYVVFIFPIVSALLFPIATLDSNIVKAKGFHIPGFDTKSEDPFVQRQFLRPDTSIYYGKDDYDDLMRKELKRFSQSSSLVLNDQNYLKVIETIYQFPGEFSDKEMEMDGFVYHDETTNKNELFLLRFGIIHCIADSGVYGLLVQFPDAAKLKNDDWIHVKGKLSTIYYQPYNATIPYVQVESWHSIKQPEEPYVFRGYDN